ncbi:hypothetical protein C1646_758091 [Rhizophagus diaphanus]|nr:hypothetical protein C1646_758091 [Rhizophagus diaphanus] [Rhizophagus sp. MUCL 43196]
MKKLQEDKSFVGWLINNQERRSFTNLTRWFTNNDEDTQEDESFVGCTKDLVGWFIKDSQEEKSFVGFIKWAGGFNKKDKLNDNKDDNDNYGSRPLTFDDKIQPYKLLDLGILDFKVSDEKILMYEGNNGLAIIYDMKNRKEITLHSSLRKYADDKYKFNFPYYNRKPVILIYSSNITKDNSWKCKSTYELDDMNTMEINFGGITNDMIWMLSDNTIFILNLFTFRYRKILLEVDVDIKMIRLKFFKSLMVISVDDMHYIYSNRIIKSITETDLKNSVKYYNILKTFLETDNTSSYFNIRYNDQKVFGIFCENPWIINMKMCNLETYILKDNSINYIDSQEINNSKDLVNENIFYNIEKQFVASIEDGDEFIMKYIMPHLVNLDERQNGNMRLKRDRDKIISEFIDNTNSYRNKIVSSYYVKDSKNWKDIQNNPTIIKSTYFITAISFWRSDYYREYIPFPSYVTYPQEYNWLDELLINPQSSPFSRTQNNELFKTWNGEAIINFKWRWIEKKLFVFSIILGSIHLSFEVRQFIWSPNKWISDTWNLFDLSAYLVPVITSIYWINSYVKGNSTDYTKAISVSCLLLYFNWFCTFIFILLKPKSDFSENEQGNLNDPNNPWSTYKKISSRDKNSLSAWSPNDNPLMIILMIIFSFVVVVYLMNLFIGLLNKILKEIELFYLLPNQRRWKTWFPDIIYYYADIDKTCQTIKKLTNEGTWKTNEMRENLLKLAFGN